MTKSDTKKLTRLYLGECQSAGQVLDLSMDLMHYTSRVLRLRDGSTLRLWNGRGQEFIGSLHYLSKKEAQIKLAEGPIAQTDSELNRPVWIVQSLPESDKMDWVIEKGTELGATAFYPVQAKRSVVKLNDERAEKRQAHWQRVCQAAGLQSERSFLPTVHPVNGLTETLKQIRTESPQADILFFSPEAALSLKQWCTASGQAPIAKSDQPLVICIGPEGGFDPKELEVANEFGAVALRFSNRILRTETFALACLSQLTVLLNLEPESQNQL